MDDLSARDFHWRADSKPWFVEQGIFPLAPLLPLTALFAFVAPVVAYLCGFAGVVLTAAESRKWIRTWRSVTDIRVAPDTGHLVLRQRYGRTRTYPLDSLTALRPLQVGAVSFVSAAPGEDEERTERDELLLRLCLGDRVHTTYPGPHRTAQLAPLVAALRRACPGMAVADTEFRRPIAVDDDERGASLG
ncbi:hypothetical protein ACIQNU_12245 [Streptomyces sp. NPDC091292]|uniref:hypothetical protein n=1 Tax=Streptomyces sp. NPDC091292 TaxID=3365991 RepID=UPI0037F56480